MMKNNRPPALPAICSSSWTPRSISLFLLRRTAKKRRDRILERDRREAKVAAGALFAATLDRPVFVIDGYYGGVIVWDWLVLPGGGFWYSFLWPLVGETVLQRLKEHPRLRAVLVLDGATFEEMAEKDPAALSRIRESLAAGHMELVNGTYALPPSPNISAESNIRQLYQGLSAIRDALGLRVESYLVDPPQFFPQLPQILAGFGFKRVVLRTHWAAFGGDPGEDAAVLRWRGPDGTEIPVAPRYHFMDSNLPGEWLDALMSDGITASDLDAWDNDRLERFRDEVTRRGIEQPLISRLAGPLTPQAPFPGIAAVAARRDIRFVTPREYFAIAADGADTVSYNVEQFPNPTPWGLGGGRLQRDIVEAEGGLQLAERLDALAYAMGRNSEGPKIEAAWKDLLRAQDHNINVFGPWLSRRHGRSMAEVGQDMAITARKRAGEVSQGAAAFLASLVDSSSLEGRAFVLFNLSSWPRREYVELTLKGDGFRLFCGGREVPSQVMHRGVGEVTLGFVVGVPPLGYRLLDVVPFAQGSGPELPEPDAAAAGPPVIGDADSLDNAFYSARFDSQGCLRLDVDGKTLIDGGYLTVWKDGRYHDSRDGAGNLQLFQQGSVLNRYRTDGRLAGVPFCLWFTLYRALPRIDLRVEFDFGSRSTFGPQPSDHSAALPYHLQEEKKLCFNFLSALRRSFSDSPFLISDVAGERITGLSLLGLDGESGAGVALLNRGTPGYHFDREKGLLRNVLAWAPARWLDAGSIKGGKSRHPALKGGYAYECALFPFDSRLKVVRAAADYQLPCLGVLLRPRPGRLPSEGSFLKVEPEQVLLSSLSVQKDKVYARVWNATPESRQASLGSGGPLVLHACSLDLTSQAPAGSIDLPPWGIQTLHLGGAASR